MAKILVTGGAGFIGSHLTDALLKEGHIVTTLDNLSRGSVKNLNPRAENLVDDIRNVRQVNQLVQRVDLVFHLAFLARVRPSIEDPVGYNDVNLNGSLNVIDACRRYRKKIIFASSSSVFGESEPPFDEETDFAPMNPYALQKLMCEMYIRIYGDLFDLDYTILRYFNVYGSRQIIGGSYSTVIGTFLDQRSRAEPLSIFGDGEQKRDFTHIEDVIKANLLAIEHSGEFNIGRGHARSVNEIAQMIGGEVEHFEPIPGESRLTLCDNSKAREVMGWIPKIDVTKEIIESLANEN